MGKKLITKQVIIFKEHNNHQRVLPAGTQDELAESCLLVLRERYNNPAWGYKPVLDDYSEEEKDFIVFWEKDSKILPELLYRQGQRLYDRLIEQQETEDETDPDWGWYRKVEQLLNLPPHLATGYKVPYGGRYIPSSYYLLLHRRNYPNENFVLAEQQVPAK